MINSDVLDLIQSLFSGPNSERSKQAESSYNRARGLSEGEDYIKAHDLFVRRLKTEVEHEQLSKLRAEVNRKLEAGPENLTLDDLTKIDMQVDGLSKKLGRSFGVKSRVEGERVRSVDTSGLDQAVNQVYRQHATVASEIDETVSPQMAARLSYDYRNLGEQERQQTMKTAPTEQLIRGLVGSGNQEDLNRVLKESGQKAPSGFARFVRNKSGGDEGELYQEAAEKVVGEEQDLFRRKLEEVALEKARTRAQEIEQQYKLKAEEQGELLSRWKDEGEQPYLEDLRALREKGFLKPEEAAEYVNNREEIVNDPVRGQALAADVITARSADQGTETAFGYPVNPQQEQQGGAVPMGLGAAAGAAGKAGSLLGDSRAGQMAGKVINSGALRALGPAALGFAGLSATADLTAMSGRTGAGSVTNAVTSTLPGIGGLAGSLGGPVGTAVGLGLGYGASKVVGGVMDPYADQVAFAKQAEAISGENLQGEGAQNNLLQALQVATPFWASGGAGGLRESQNRARLKNPFLDPAQISALTDELLRLGDSVESAAEKVEPLSRVVADFNLAPALVAQLERAGSTGSLGGVETARYVASMIQSQAGRGLTQQDISGYVGQAIETLGPVSGYAEAPESALAYSGLMSRGGEEADLLFQNAGTVGKMIESDAAMMNDPMAMMMMGMDPSLSPEQQDPGAMAAGRIELAKQLGGMVEMAPDGNLSTNGRYQLQMAMQMEPWASAFKGMSVDEVAEMITNPNITPDNARKEFETQQKERKKKEKQQSLAAKGIGSGKWSGDGLTYDQWDANKLYRASRDQAKGDGAVGRLVGQNKDIDLENVRLAGKGDKTLADALGDPDLLKRLNQGKQKIRVGGKNLTVADYNLQDIRGQAYLGEKGGLNLGEPGKGEKAGYKAEIDLSERASKYFEVKDVRNPQGAAGSTTESQHAHATNTGKKNLNDKPIYGGG
ncbi:hypothetical protein GBA63_09140 [Rubrobacter tropicus]|uniref:Uncharacterized protein n=1 Tax=Rubrobacter tropicus TaxID=2653851 RepID=A0A6G8Q8J6_9ACTN|nr:hypothetical protein [Rubrobacter tropicus]QIN82796.1 hypothetical protein GBA63_09140 [Rubrobacter tropicus]